MKNEDVVIIGGGIAGISCAIQLVRYGIKPILIEKKNLGGLLLNANRIENYPGFPEGISGVKLTELLKRQLNQEKVQLLFEEVLSLELNGRYLKTVTKKLSLYSRLTVIASGTKPRKFGEVDIPDELTSRIFYEVHPLIELEDRKVAIVGGGDVAFDYALNLERKNEVVILNRGEKAKSIPVLRKRTEKTSKIDYIKNIRIFKISGSVDNTLVLKCKIPGGQKEIKADYLLFAIGRRPQLDFVSPEVKNEISGKKRMKRIYLAGDVKNDIYRQAAIAAGDGIMVAMKINKRKHYK